jgi:hypothetical protein
MLRTRNDSTGAGIVTHSVEKKANVEGPFDGPLPDVAHWEPEMYPTHGTLGKGIKWEAY